jgi:hypothetical protein
MRNTVRHAIWGPMSSLAAVRRTRYEIRTKILDVYSALVPQSGIVDIDAVRLGDGRAIAALCNPQAIDVESGGLCDFLENLCSRFV